MEYLEIDGRLYEFTVVSEAEGSDVAVECEDMSTSVGGFVGTLRVGAEGKGVLTLASDVPIAVLVRWIELAKSDAGLML